MASVFASALAGLGALLFFGCVGLPVARALFPDRSLAFASAPALGWAVFSAAALPILCVVGFSPAAAGALAGSALLASVAGLRAQTRNFIPSDVAAARVPVLAYLAAGLCALAPAIALLPHGGPDGVMLAAPIFDHSKVAIVDEIARNGVPPQNPFYGGAGASWGLAYYYLWHFSAALLSLLPGVSGWEADIALTGVTAFATLSLVMGLAVRLSGLGAAAYWALALSLAASARPAMISMFGGDLFGTWLSSYPGLGAVMVQAAWAPQHVASAACVVLAVLLIERLSERPDAAAAVTLGLVAAAGFGSSVWIGGFVFLAASAGTAVVLLLTRGVQNPAAFAGAALAAASVAACAAAPILAAQIAAAGARPEGLPLAYHPYEVVGPWLGAGLRRALDLPAYWAVLLPVDLPAVYPVGAAALAVALLAATQPAARRFAALSACVATASFGVAWLFTSTLLNNDLGWRAILPGALILTVFAAAAIARWTAPPFRPSGAAAAGVALALLLIGLADGVRFMIENAGGRPSASAQAFARSPALWAAVRRRSAPNDRIANNPAAFADVTRWPANISWALLADRRSCYAGWEFARPFAPLSKTGADELDRSFRSVFAGTVSADAAKRLFAEHDCRLIVVTPADGAWEAASFLDDPAFQRVDDAPGAWRIFRYVGVP